MYADVEPASRHGVVITENVTASGASLVDPMKAKSPADGAVGLEQYAGLHARTWNDPRVGRADWMVAAYRSLPAITEADPATVLLGRLGAAATGHHVYDVVSTARA